MKRVEITFTFDDGTRATSVLFDETARPGVILDDDAVRKCLNDNPAFLCGSSFEDMEKRFRVWSSK